MMKMEVFRLNSRLLSDLVNYYIVFRVHLYFASPQKLRVRLDAWWMKEGMKVVDQV